MPNVVSITSPDDPRVAAYREVRERDLAGRDGLFVAEGEVVLRTLISGRSRFRPASVLLAENRVASLADLLSDLAVPVLVAPSAVMDRIAGFPIHRGILAAGSRGPASTPTDVLAPPRGPALALGLVGLANHDNVGGAFRNAAAFGVDAVLLDGATCDPLYRKAIRVSVGASLTVPFARAGTEAAVVDALEAAGFAIFALSPNGRENLHEIAWPDRSALLLGAEGPGLPAAIMERVRTLRIPMAAGFDSLNVATASGIALHAAFTGATRTRSPGRTRVPGSTRSPGD